MLPSTKTEVLKQIRREINKEFIEFDSSSRVQFKFIAPIYATDGTPCLVIEYIYYGATTVVKGRKEGYSYWSSVFDGNPAFLVDDLGNQLQDNLANDLVEVL